MRTGNSPVCSATPTQEFGPAAPRAWPKPAGKARPPLLLELLADPNEPVRIAAAMALGQLGDATVVPGVGTRLSQRRRQLCGCHHRSGGAARSRSPGPGDRHPARRNDALSRARLVRTIGGLKPPHPIRLLESLFRDRTPEVRIAAAEVLGRVAGDEPPVLLGAGLSGSG